MTPLMQAVSTALVHFLWQGVVVGFMLWIALRLLRQASAQARYAVSCGALLVMAILPLCTAAIVYNEPVVDVAISQGEVRTPSSFPIAAGQVASRTLSWMGVVEPWAIPVWSLGVLLFSLRLALGGLAISTMKRRGEAVDADILAMVARLGDRLGLRKAINVLKTAEANGPSVVGWIRPVVLLPASTMLGLTPQQLESVLAHELAHIRRHDHFVNAVQSLVETALFYHPAVWWASASIRHERELCCDDLAVRACGDAICYARALTKLERLRVMTPLGAVGSTGGLLGYRIRRLMGMSNREYGPSKWHGFLALALGLAGVALTVNWARGQEVKEQAPEPLRVAVRYSPNDLVGDSSWIMVDLRGANLLHRTGVEYPEAAMKAGVSGTVNVEVTLDGAGNVNDARVLSGPMELRKPVIASVLQWHFAPAAAGTTRSVNVTFQKVPAGSTARISNKVGTEQIAVAYQANAGQVERERQQELEMQQRAIQAMEQAREDQLRGVAEIRPDPVDLQTARKMNEIRGALRSLQQQYERMVGSYTEDYPAVVQTRRQIDELQGQLRDQERSAGTARQEQRQADQFQRRSSDAAQRLELRNDLGRGRVQTIEAPELTEQARADLLSRLPVHIGDTLAEESLAAIRQVVRQYDEHLRVTVSRGQNDGDVVIHIVPLPIGVRK